MSYSRSAFIRDRQPPCDEVQERHSSQFADHVATELRTCLSTPAGGSDLEPGYGMSATDIRALLDYHGLELYRPGTLFNGTVRDGCRVQGTFYDQDWSVGGGLAFGGRYDGKVITVSTDGVSAAALGFYLSSSEPATVAVTPNGRYDFSLLGLKDTPGLLSQGGLGVTVYHGDDISPAYSRRVTLWDERGDLRNGKLLGGASGNGQIAAASSPALPNSFGPVPPAPVVLALASDESVLVWVWSWQATVAGDGFLAFLTMTMPAVTVCAGPPLVGPR